MEGYLFSSSEHPSASSSEDEGGQGMVNISLFSTNPEILYSFPCTEIKEGVELFPRCVHVCVCDRENCSLVT